MEKLIEVASHSDPGVTYTVDTENKTCTCPAFTKSKTKKPCKHIAGIPGLLPPAPKRPTYSAGVSALIKAVRLRRPDDVAYWYHYLTTFPEATFKLQRRVVIIGAEDNLSTERMKKISMWFNSYKDSRVKALGNLLAICKTPNWWAIPQGHQYIECCVWAEHEAKNSDYKEVIEEMPADLLMDEIMDSLIEGDAANGMLLGELLWKKPMKSKKNPDGWAMAQFLEKLENTILLQQWSGPSDRMLTLINGYGSLLWGDFNYLWQAVYRVANPFDVEDTGIKMSEVKDRIAHAKERWKDPQPIQPFYLDGIHTSGSDKRFAGTPRSMLSCVRAYKHYGVLNPHHEWKPSFWELPKPPK